jgi:intracellular multiplication protein IcmJ
MTQEDPRDPAVVDLNRVSPKAGLGANFDTPAYPVLGFSTKSRVWGDKAPKAIEPTEQAFVADSTKAKVIAKDGYRCMFCGFFAQNHEVHSVSDNHQDIRAENLRAADVLCHGWQHLGELAADDAVIAYLPGLGGQDVNHLQRTIMVALQADDEAVREDARKLLNWMASHRDYVSQAWHTYEPASFGSALARMAEEDPETDREKRQVSFAGLAVVFRPAAYSDHVKAWVREAYGSMPVQKWREVFHDVMNAPA